MIEHYLHNPYPQPIPIPAAKPGPTCPFCGAAGHTPGTVCSRCNVASPSPLSEISIAELLRRKKHRRRAPGDYSPQTDGINGHADPDEGGELEAPPWD